MKKLLILGFIGLGLIACDKQDKAMTPLDIVKYATLNDTFNFCMKVNGNKDYCDCENLDLEKSFPWEEYIAVVDVLAGEKNHIEKVIVKYKGNREEILSELNCSTCYFAVALGAIEVSPSPECALLLNAH